MKIECTNFTLSLHKTTLDKITAALVGFLFNIYHILNVFVSVCNNTTFGQNSDFMILISYFLNPLSVAIMIAANFLS